MRAIGSRALKRLDDPSPPHFTLPNNEGMTSIFIEVAKGSSFSHHQCGTKKERKKASLSNKSEKKPNDEGLKMLSIN